MYELLLFIHIAAAIIWVGGAFFITLYAYRVMASPDPADVPKFGRNVAFLGLRVFFPISIVLFLAGLGMTAMRWSFATPWINISMLLWLLSVLAGALYIGPRTAKVAELFEAEGPRSPAALSLYRRLLLVGRIDLLNFTVIVALMTFKPFT